MLFLIFIYQRKEKSIMAKIKVLGDTIQLTSDITAEEFDRVKRFAPEALIMKDADTGDEVFGISRGDAFVSKYGVCFCSVDNEGKLFMTTNNVVTDHSDREAELKAVKEFYAPIMAKLGTIEAHLKNVMAELEELEASVESSIEFI